MSDDVKLTQRTGTVTLYQGEDLDRIEAAKTRIQDAAARVDRTRDEDAAHTLMSDANPAAELEAAVAEHDQLVADAADRAVVVKVAPLGRRRFRALIEEHPPRDGVKADENLGADDSTFPDALVAESITEPAFNTDRVRDAFLDSLTDAQFEEIYQAAFALNRGLSAAPKALAPLMSSLNAGGTHS